ncbi:LexA family transcriptional regulator [Sphingomonas abietis]|uniref:LexA repressor DNA-binding domain-containing protein n=1 Tax=Sphingomonas abietis TaxID=3012344 RepID=A0ABY7NTR2_9SPHN|nr:hypothetical protein [Sphingomonas abietis]WBO23947.1 hypothetical protein PBT88_07510 [Sphingomonas abietis]
MNMQSRLTARDSISAPARVLRMLNQWFTQSSIPPSYREIAFFSGVSLPRVRGYLDVLEGRGHLTHKPGVERSIEMADRCANICTDELIRALHGRNMTVIVKPPPVAAVPICEAFPLDPQPKDDLLALVERIV